MTFGWSFCKKGHCIHILWCIFMGLIHNGPWVESHMWPQQPWGLRSSRGQWPFSYLNRYGVKYNITMTAQVCDRESRRDSWFENRLVFITIWSDLWPTVRFDSSESITDGVDASTRCKIAGNSNEPWELQLTSKTGKARLCYNPGLQSLKKHWDDVMAVLKFHPLSPCKFLTGVMLLISLLHLPTLIGGGSSGITGGGAECLRHFSLRNHENRKLVATLRFYYESFHQ